MVKKLERYANNLEELVDKRTEELFQEKKKTDQLLYRMLPTYALLLTLINCVPLSVLPLIWKLISFQNILSTI